MNNPTMISFALLALSFLLGGTTTMVAGFGSISMVAPLKTTRIVGALHSTKGDDDDLAGPEYTGDVDWDAEWKKVMEKERTGQASERPGKDYYKSEAEIAAIRAANKAQTEVQKISSNLPSAPSMNMQSLTGDWRFWIGILALISIGSAVLSAPPSYDAISSGDSYYI